ncbi:MAG: transglutaminase family protein [Polyangiaceae bacterium]|nr:transglutaminase family protein [Polyangiaceae bacterium]
MNAGRLAHAELLEGAREHDARLRERGLEIWIGAEPTFTLRESQEPWWLWDADGGDKLDRARTLLAALAPRLAPEAQLFRVVGRQYPGEPGPRFALAAVWERGGAGGRRRGGGERAALDWLERSRWLEPLPCAMPAADERRACLTVTPDPGVVEVNMAPAPDLETFSEWIAATYAAAADAGLSPLRYRWNGELGGSGGGGQVTLGGPALARSPFALHPQLLPRMIRYWNRHPSLSYAFAPEHAGSASQGPRADEGDPERFHELGVTLDRLARRGDAIGLAELHAALAPLLVDASGNTHRAELNVEKLCGADAARGQLGVVELRALEMPPTPERLVALGALFRALAASLALHEPEERLAAWGDELHDRFALPALLLEDLACVLGALEARGLGLPAPLAAELRRAPEPWHELELGGARLVVTPAREFWPLLGDVASQESRPSRLVDSSTRRLELRVVAPGGDPGTVAACGFAVPLAPIEGRVGEWVGAVRFRAFRPCPGLHPDLAPVDPVVLEWRQGGAARAVALHGWRPGGGAYPALPASDAEARARRLERAVATAPDPTAPAAPRHASRYTLDLRREASALRA